MSDKSSKPVASPTKELFTAIGLLAIVSPCFFSLLAPDPSKAVKILLIVLGLLLTCGGLLALLYGISYPSVRKKAARMEPDKKRGQTVRTEPDKDKWKMSPEEADKPLYDLSKYASGSSAGVRTPWQHDMTPLRWTIMPERLWMLPDLEWRPLPITLGLGSLGLLAAVIPWMVDYLTNIEHTQWVGLFRVFQLALLAGGIALLLYVAPRVPAEEMSSAQREQLAKDREYFRSKRRF